MKEHGTPGPHAVICKDNEIHSSPMRVFLSEEEYNRQMDRPDDTWSCPLCGSMATWDDDNLEKYLVAEE